jgi:hypothetical protein
MKQQRLGAAVRRNQTDADVRKQELGKPHRHREEISHDFESPTVELK